jgi:hypothetical protein
MEHIGQTGPDQRCHLAYGSTPPHAQHTSRGKALARPSGRFGRQVGNEFNENRWLRFHDGQQPQLALWVADDRDPLQPLVVASILPCKRGMGLKVDTQAANETTLLKVVLQHGLERFDRHEKRAYFGMNGEALKIPWDAVPGHLPQVAVQLQDIPRVRGQDDRIPTWMKHNRGWLANGYRSKGPVCVDGLSP